MQKFAIGKEKNGKEGVKIKIETSQSFQATRAGLNLWEGEIIEGGGRLGLQENKKIIFSCLRCLEKENIPIFVYLYNICNVYILCITTY